MLYTQRKIKDSRKILLKNVKKNKSFFTVVKISAHN